MKAHRADLGVALDGDADRLQLVDADGRLYNGDELLYLMADDRLGRDEHVPGVVGTLMTNLAVEVALKVRGKKPLGAGRRRFGPPACTRQAHHR